MLGHCYRDLGEPDVALHYFSQFDKSQRHDQFFLECMFYKIVVMYEMDADVVACIDAFASEIQNIDIYIKHSNDKKHLGLVLKHAAVFFNLLDKPVEFILVAKALLKLYMAIPDSLQGKNISNLLRYN